MNIVAGLDELDQHLRVLLPEQYGDTYETVQPTSMGSAQLKYDAEGRVAWNDIWRTFCDLAMAGGPPHRGTLLRPATRDEIAQAPSAHRGAIAEICRGVHLAAALPAAPSSIAGWVEADCHSHSMAGWLARAIAMENVSTSVEGPVLRLPAGPSFRVDKEIKNVVTAVAKTCHYWRDHMGQAQRREIANLLTRLNTATPLLQPDADSPSTAPDTRAEIASMVCHTTGLQPSAPGPQTWIGFECGQVRPAVWMMRALVAWNVMSRRESTVLFVPVNPAVDPTGARAAHAIIEVAAFARRHGVLEGHPPR